MAHLKINLAYYTKINSLYHCKNKKNIYIPRDLLCGYIFLEAYPFHHLNASR